MNDTHKNKDVKVTVRLTPHQSFMIEEMSKQLEVNKSVLIRYILDQFIDQFHKAE